MHTIARHKTSNLLVDHQAADAMPLSETDITNRIASAVAYAGGTVNDWEVIAIPNELWTGINLRAELTAVIENGQLTGINQSTPPTLNKVDGVGSVTVNLSAGAYSGEVKWTCITPGGAMFTATGTAVNGVDSWEIDTSEGSYLVQAIVPGFGVGQIEFQGV